MNKNNRRKNIGIKVLLILSIISIIGSVWKKILEEKKDPIEPNKYKIEEGEIIAEIPYEDMVDVIVREADDMAYYSFEVSDSGKKYKEVFSSGIVNYFSYEGRGNVERKGKRFMEEDVESHLNVLNAFFEKVYQNVKRKPYCGVSINEEIYKLKVNDYSADKIIEYEEGEQKFYIWYFSDLSKFESFTAEIG